MGYTSAQSSDNLIKTLLPWIVSSAILVVLPFIFTGGGSVTIMNQIGITIVMAMSYNMLLGQGGMLSFGHAVYMGLGGFVAVHIMNFVEGGLWLPLPFLPTGVWVNRYIKKIEIITQKAIK